MMPAPAVMPHTPMVLMCASAAIFLRRHACPVVPERMNAACKTGDGTYGEKRNT